MKKPITLLLLTLPWNRACSAFAGFVTQSHQTQPRRVQQQHSSSSSLSSQRTIRSSRFVSSIYAASSSDTGKEQRSNESNNHQQDFVQAVKKNVASAALCGAILLASLSTSSNVANAYDATDYASETVQTVIQALRKAGANPDETFKAYEYIGDIITEGKGVGGAINYKGIQLERGYVADEDTSIYNPGLTLLTESEKERLVEAIIGARKAGLQQNTWNTNNQVAFDFLREKLDPFHTYELRGYLSIVPFYAVAVYLVVLAVQQLARDLFPAAYFIGVAAIFGPALVLIIAGPQ